MRARTTRRDAYEVCSLIPSADERQQCYSVFGLDASRMNAYYDTVLSLEQQLASDLHGTGERSARAQRASPAVAVFCRRVTATAPAAQTAPASAHPPAPALPCCVVCACVRVWSPPRAP